MTIQIPNFEVQWWLVIIIALVAFGLGVLVSKRFGTDWLGALAYLVGDTELTLIAQIVWQSNLVPESVMRFMFKNDETKFIAWVLEKAHTLNPVKVENVRSVAAYNGFAIKGKDNI